MSPARGRSLGAPLIVGPTERHIERGGALRGLTSSRRFFERLRDELEGGRARPAPRALTRLLAKNAALASASPSASASERSGLGLAADATLGAFARSGVTARDLERTNTARGRWLAGISAGVAESLARLELYDARSAIDRSSLEALVRGEADLPEAIRIVGTVGIDPAFVDAWLVVHAAIRARGGRGVTLCWPRSDGAQRDAMSSVAEALEQRLAEEADPFDIEWSEAHAPAGVSVIEAHGDVAEARAVVDAVARGLERGVRVDRVFVVVPSRDEAFLEPLRAAFREAGIAMGEAWGPPVASSPEARGVLAILDMAAGRLDRGALVELLRTPGLHPGSLVRDRDEASAVERAAALAQRLADLPVLQDKTGRLFVEVLRAQLEADAGDAGSFWMVSAMEKLAESIESLRSASGVGPFLGNLLALVDRMRLGDPSAFEVHRALASGTSALRAIAEGAVAVRAVREAIEQMNEAYRVLGAADATVDLAELALDLEGALSGARTAARGAAGRAAAVRVGDLQEVLGLEHDLVVLTRASGRAYAPLAAPTLDDEETRRRLPPRVRLVTTRERAAIREAQIAWALSSAREVVLSWSSTDTQGRESEPPHARVTAALEGGAPRRVEPASRVVRGASILSAHGEDLSQLSLGRPPGSDLHARVRIELERQAFFMDPRQAPGPFTGLVPTDALAELGDRVGGTSPTSAVSVTFVERAFACPFRAFADRVLRARRSEEIQDVLGPRERGDLLHRALFVAYESDRAHAPSATVEARVQGARAAIERDLALDKATPLRRAGHERTIEDAIAVFTDDIAQPTGFVYLAGERRFAANEPPPWGPLELSSADGRRVYVEGRIDRLDATPDRSRIRVVDYKSGKPRGKTRREGDFQVPLYALVAKRQGAAETSGVYFAITAGGAVTLSPSKEADRVWPDDELEAAATGAAEAVSRLWRGDVAPRPVSLSVCKRCDARDLCRRPAVMPESTDEDPG